ncbi:peroxisome proliferator-activated receptor gamma coactivator 1-alpha isoform X1 [Brienomyrus brachyistius]|uniref:peroxisome proliferator-activated receptor gamma coactivator 1-alpha isoform X1 n=1 Tax=Brienomyrus brachyistius TaxID=42636 RepID=UPI0020B25175|nr:peroxisome proliferator-activated receptor gamma coactivator 1-alpha isoform X1 [Brienomyrus brachyistius]
MAWDRCNQDSVWTELECAALVGEDQPLCPDLPELDLSELDVSDLDADSFLGGFKWYSDQSEVISSQYGNEAANLFEKIDEENEANLLAVLTETLDSIPVDEDGLPSFEALADGDVTNTSEQSCPSTPDGSPPAQEAEEPSLLKKLLLAPTNSQLDYGQYPGSKAQGHAAGGQRLRPPPGVAKTENPWNGKQRSSIPQQNRPVRRPCTELLKYLTASDEVLRTKASQKRGGRTGSGSGNSGKDKAGGASSSSSSPSSSSTSSFSSLSSSCSSSSSKTKPPPAPVPSLPPRQPSHPQRGESRAAGACGVAGVSGGRWSRCVCGAGTEGRSEPAAPSPVAPGPRRNGHMCPRPEHGPPGREGRPPGQQSSLDMGHLPAARFIRYMHSYSLPPRETGQPDSCERCREEARTLASRNLGGARHADRHITVTIRKREAPEHPLLSKLLTSDRKAVRPLGHWGRSASPPARKMLPWAWESDGSSRQAGKEAMTGSQGLFQARWHAPEHQISEGPGEPAYRARELGEGVVMKVTVGHTERVGHAEDDVDGDVLGGPVSYSPGFLSPLFPDSVIPVGDLEPSVTQEPHLHTQALCRHPGDQVLPLLAKPTILPLPLTPESPNDHKGSPFENKTIERTLSVELSGTAGLTPPTTPPHKTSQENPFKPSMKTKLPSCPSSAVGSKRARLCDNTPHPATAGTVALEGAEHGELYAQLSKASAPSAKRGAPRAMGDHDYCQSTGTSAGRDVSLCSRPAGPERRCAECAESGQPSLPPSSSSSSSSSSLAGQSGNGSESETALGRRDTPEDQPAPARQPSSTARKPLLDQEIRAELNRHFGPPQRAVSVDVESDRPHPPEDIGAWDDYLPPGLPLEDSEDERELLLCPWETSPLDLLFESSPSCSPYSCSPSRGSVSPPAVSPQRFHWPRSRSTSHRRQPSPCPRSRSPYSHSGSRSRHHADTGTCKSRTQRSPQTQSRPRCDSYEEHQHACLRRDDHRRDHEHCESDRVQQWEGQRKKAVEERRTLCVGRLRPDGGRAELRRRFEVFGEIEECVVSLRDDGDTFGFITYRYSCDAFTALENGHTLLQPNEPPFELCFGGRKQFCRSSYTELESHCDDFDPASAKSKYDSMDFDSLLREAQRSLKR